MIQSCFFERIPKHIVLLLALFAITINGFGQSLKWIDGYKMNIDIGLLLRQDKIYTPSSASFGALFGISVQHPNKRFGLNLRVNYLYFLKYSKDSLGLTNSSFFNTYIELTYKIFYIHKCPFRVGMGIAKPSFKMNPFYGCPYCANNAISFSIQQQIRTLTIEFRIEVPIGSSYWGWKIPFSTSNNYISSIGINYTFDLKRKNNIKI